MSPAPSIAIIGAGPSGLIAAETLANAGMQVHVFDRMPSPGRKFLIAGRGGLNLTHSEPLDTFLTRYGPAAAWLEPAIRAFPPEALRAWCEGLGEETFIGSSGRVFPKRMKAVTLLRHWLRRLEALGVHYHPRHHWRGWDGSYLHFTSPTGDIYAEPHATLLALGGASWPRLGSDGSWSAPLAAAQVPLAPFAPSNCGFLTPWSEHLRTRFAGQPLKPLAITHAGVTRQGEAMITEHGIEGGLLYGFSPALRDAIRTEGKAVITLDLRPGMPHDALQQKLGARGSRSLGSYLQSAGFSPLAVALFHETGGAQCPPQHIAAHLKSMPLTLHGTTGMARAISTAGGITHAALDTHYMLRNMPGVFAAGEMLDWEAPTGGYLLQACFSTGIAAAHGIGRYVQACQT